MSEKTLLVRSSVRNSDAFDLCCQPEIERSRVRSKFSDALENVPTSPLPLQIGLIHFLDDRVESVPSTCITRSGHSHRIIAYANDILVMRKYYQST